MRMKRALFAGLALLLWARPSVAQQSQTFDRDDASIAVNQTAGVGLSLVMAFDGSVWRRLTFGTAGTASAQVLTIQGIASMTPILSTVTNAGTFSVQCSSGCSGGTSDADDASIAAAQTTGIQLGLTQVYDGSVWRRLTIGTAGTASTQVLTVQGIASMTPMLATLSGTNNIATVTAVTSITNTVTTAGGKTNNNAAPGATNVGTLGCVANASAPSWTEGNLVGCSADLSGAQRVSITNGSATDADDASIATGQTGVAATLGLTQVYDGSVWRRLTIGTAGTASAQVLTVQGVASMTPLLVTVTNDSVTDTDDASIATAQVGIVTDSLGMVYDGSVWRRLTIGTAGTASAQVTTVQGIASMTPLLATVTNAGTFAVQCSSGCTGGTSDTDDASIATGQTIGLSGGLTQVYDGSVWRRLTIGTAGTASAQVLTIQGIASMTKLLVTPDSVALPANQSVNVAQLAGTTTDTNSGSKSAGTLRVVLATDQPALTNKLLVTPDSVALPANQSVNVSQINGVTTTMGNGASGTGVQRVTIASDSTGTVTPAGQTLKRYISVGTSEDESQVKATAGVLLGVSARNAHATTIAYLKCTNLTAANTTPGSSTIFYEMIVPAAGGVVDREINATFDTALTCYIVTGKTDADATEVAANDVSYNLTYR